MVSHYLPRGSKSGDDISEPPARPVSLDKTLQFSSFPLHDKLQHKDLEMNKTTSLLSLPSLVREDLPPYPIPACTVHVMEWAEYL